jgi:hypothetical protein
MAMVASSSSSVKSVTSGPFVLRSAHTRAILTMREQQSSSARFAASSKRCPLIGFSLRTRISSAGQPCRRHAASAAGLFRRCRASCASGLRPVPAGAEARLDCPYRKRWRLRLPAPTDPGRKGALLSKQEETRRQWMMSAPPDRTSCGCSNRSACCNAEHDLSFRLRPDAFQHKMSLASIRQG